MNLLWKTHFGPFFRSFSLNISNIRLKRSKKWTQNDFPSLRFPKSDRLLEEKEFPQLYQATEREGKQHSTKPRIKTRDDRLQVALAATNTIWWSQRRLCY